MATRKNITPIMRMANKPQGIVNVPPHLIQMQYNRYPPDNGVTFEMWYFKNYTYKDDRERIYLPIQWTALYCNNGYGNGPIIKTIQKFIDELDKTKKYYTIVQYDDGILNNIKALDIKVIAMSGPRIDFAIPMLCTPHKFNFKPGDKRDIFASFIGSLTHPIRAAMVDQLKDKEGYYVTTKQHNLYDYCKILARSKYALCPRGYGQSSFRIQEAIDMGAIPVYISDEFVMPYNMPVFPFGVTIPVGPDFNTNIDDILKYHEDENNGISIIKECINRNKSLFTYQGCKQEILKYLEDEMSEDRMSEPGNETN